jgi:hypothetical protein
MFLRVSRVAGEALERPEQAVEKICFARKKTFYS